jgi:hypothetical protein
VSFLLVNVNVCHAQCIAGSGRPSNPSPTLMCACVSPLPSPASLSHPHFLILLLPLQTRANHLPHRKSISSTTLIGYADIDGASSFWDGVAQYLSCDPSGGGNGDSAVDLFGLNN